MIVALALGFLLLTGIPQGQTAIPSKVKPGKPKQLLSEAFAKSAFLALKTIQRHHSIQPSDEVLKAIDGADADAHSADEDRIVSALKAVEAGHFLRNLRRARDEAFGAQPTFEDDDEMQCFAAFEVSLKARSVGMPKACDLLKAK